MDILADQASPEKIARVTKELGCRSVAYTYNDPVILMEYAIGVFFKYMDAANIDLKAFSEDFYHDLTGGHLQPVLDMLKYLNHETDVWIEITTLLIPYKNDFDEELNDITNWVVENLGADVPMHFTVFYTSWKILDIPPTPPATLTRRRLALDNGVCAYYRQCSL